MADRYFTLEEAQGLVGWLEESFGAMRPFVRRLSDLEKELVELRGRMGSNGGSELGGRLSRIQSELNEAIASIQRGIAAITEEGIIVRRVEDGLVDFPALREGREVHLCWRSGEAKIDYWHEVDAGIAGRQPL
jgi:hypothetical protein